MYYHDIGFLAQSKFFLYSLCAGVADGLLALLLCSKAIKGKAAVICDFIYCLLSVLLIVCVNIVMQDAALRVYQMIAFLTALILTLILLKKRSDKIALAVQSFLSDKLFRPVFRHCKYIINKLKNILKKAYDVVYNFIRSFQAKLSRLAKGKVSLRSKKAKNAEKSGQKEKKKKTKAS